MQATEKQLNILVMIGEVKYTASGHAVKPWNWDPKPVLFSLHVVLLSLLKGESHNLKMGYPHKQRR